MKETQEPHHAKTDLKINGFVIIKESLAVTDPEGSAGPAPAKPSPIVIMTVILRMFYCDAAYS